MSEEILNNNNQELTAEDYIKAIKDLKENSVSKDDYQKLVDEKKMMLQNFVNGKYDGTDDDGKAPAHRDINEIREELFSREHSNLDYVKLSLELRNALIEEGEPDPFLPVGKRIAPDDSDIAAANRCAQVYEECINYADGDSEVFTNELMRRTVDVKINK